MGLAVLCSGSFMVVCSSWVGNFLILNRPPKVEINFHLFTLSLMSCQEWIKRRVSAPRPSHTALVGTAACKSEEYSGATGLW